MRYTPLIMGILNITPDSFSDGGCFMDAERALARAMVMIEQGADIIDVGGESSRPGAVSVSIDEELSRIIPIIEQIRIRSNVRISIDTSKAAVMEAAVSAGASMINDIGALGGEGALEMAARLKIPICLMHMQGTPKTMQNNPQYTDVVDEINQFFQSKIAACLEAGIAREQLILDPGFGFGKSTEHNLRLLQRVQEFKQHQLPLLLGVSRKNTIGVVLQKSIDERLYGGLTIAIYAALQGVHMIRTHDVDATKQAFKMLKAIKSETLGNVSLSSG